MLLILFLLPLKFVFRLLEIIQEILEGLSQGAGSFNNSMPPNEALSEQILEELADNKLEREAEEIREWKENLRKKYLKDKIKSLISIDHIILVGIIYNITQILFDTNSILHFINTEDFTCLSTALLCLNQTFKNNKEINKSNEELTLEILEELKVEFRSEKRKQMIINNTVIVLNQIFIHYSIFPPHEDKEFDKCIDSLTSTEINSLVNDFFKDIGYNRDQHMILNIENNKIRKYLIRATMVKFWGIITDKQSTREEIILIMQEILKLNQTRLANNKKSYNQSTK